MNRAPKAEKLRGALTIKRQRNTIACSRAKRIYVRETISGLKIFNLIGNHFGVSRGPHLNGRGHRGLKMSSAHKRNRAPLCAEFRERFRKLHRFSLSRENLVFHVKANIHRHLIVARAARVNLLAEIAKALCKNALNCHVNILIIHANFKLTLHRFGGHRAESLANFCSLRFRDDRLWKLHL